MTTEVIKKIVVESINALDILEMEEKAAWISGYLNITESINGFDTVMKDMTEEEACEYAAVQGANVIAMSDIRGGDKYFANRNGIILTTIVRNIWQYINNLPLNVWMKKEVNVL